MRTPHSPDATLLDSFLRDLVLGRRPRTPEAMDALARLIDNPNRVASHTDLPDSDPVKIAACRAAERFEAATNGMDGDFAVDRGGQGESPADRAFRPWRELTSAIEAFYRGDEAAMLEAGRRIPDGTPPAALKSLFRRLAGGSADSPGIDRMADELLVRRRDLRDGLATLEEAAAYPDLLERELARYLPILIDEDRESACRLYLWALDKLPERRGAALSGSEARLGPGEASRLRALALMTSAPDRGLLEWLRSLSEVLADQAGGPDDLSVRLGIAGELFDDVRRTGGDTPDLRRAVRDLLSGAEAAMRLLDPDIPVLPESADDLEHWFPGRTDLTTAPVRPVAPGIRSRADDSRDLPLFAGVPA